jgi:hypothetical protein
MHTTTETSPAGAGAVPDLRRMPLGKAAPGPAVRLVRRLLRDEVVAAAQFQSSV